MLTPRTRISIFLLSALKFVFPLSADAGLGSPAAGQTPQSFPTLRWMPDRDTRAWMANVNRTRVCRIEIYRGDAGIQHNIVVTDPGLVRCFLDALTHAVVPDLGLSEDEYRNRPINMNHGIDQILIYELKNHEVVRTAILPCWLITTDSFGPEFHVALRKLAEFEAARLNSVLASKRQLVSLDLSGVKCTDSKLTDKMKDIAKEAGSEIFDYTNYKEPMALAAKLTQSDGKISVFNFVVSTATRHTQLPSASNPNNWQNQLLDLYYTGTVD